MSLTPERRRRIRERDGYKCQYCGSPFMLEVDHHIPTSRGGSDNDDNLVTACLAGRYGYRFGRTPENSSCRPPLMSH